MKNKRLKNSLIAAGVAIAVGVILFGVNAATGDAPEYQPPGSGVSPVFSGLEVVGDIELSGQNAGLLNSGQDCIPMGGCVERKLQIEDDLGVTGGVYAAGDIIAGPSTTGVTLSPSGSITAGGDVTMTGDVHIDDLIFDNGSDSWLWNSGSAPVGIWDNLLVTDDGTNGVAITGAGHITTEGNVVANGAVGGVLGLVTNGNIVAGVDITAGGQVYASGPIIAIGNITGQSVASRGYMSAGSGFGVSGSSYLNGSVTSVGRLSALDDIYLMGDLRMQSSGSEIYSTAGPVVIRDDLVFSGSGSKVGKTYTKNTYFSAGTWGGSKSCDYSTHQLLSCGMYTRSGVGIRYIYPYGTTCHGGVLNNSQYFRIYAHCLDPFNAS